MSNNVLNPRLYNLLERKFGIVKVSNQGQAAVITYRRNPLKNFRKEPVADYPGEYYQVCCPYCKDRRNRLYINHLFGTRDEEGISRDVFAVCFNENCLASSGTVADFKESITQTAGQLEKARIFEGKKVDLSKLVMKLPEDTVPLASLQPSHEAILYLRSRGFNIDTLSRYYGVRWCDHDERWWLASKRIIIPIWMQKRLVGWQSRMVEEYVKGSSVPKYWTVPGTPKNNLLYNLANAQQFKTGVIVEGPTDVWSLGPMAVATLGASISPHQLRLFSSAFKDYSGVLLWDPEEYKKEKTKKVIRQLKQMSFAKGIAVVQLPDGEDPGSLEREFMRKYIVSQAKKQGVTVSWDLK